ncbi:type II toxin-antitoxin system MqsR family toxin [Pseudomonas sp. C2B4]|uniref:type II toxin-antitoxin system MqsR family toxin n=1 Tax=Pseudomonas sp. C2B4 TaxID=2735270 RepID=UPI00158664D2|nr:type II toxin-antitoxin system MqsR family toxin [Pseudomonas sp. C2B4]NUU37174.1 type II toxin-antitoxin system MqsR family toxin [Pseudomonas sp. C2B4]
MEKSTPHYDLSVIKAEVVKSGKKAFTQRALASGHDMGLKYPLMVQAICLLERRMLYKSMTSYADHRVWQDVYHMKFYGMEIYIKVSYRPGGGHPVISFKEKNL